MEEVPGVPLSAPPRLHTGPNLQKATDNNVAVTLERSGRYSPRQTNDNHSTTRWQPAS